MKLKQVTKLDKRNKTMSKKFDDDVMSTNDEVIVIFKIQGLFGAIRKPDPDAQFQKITFSLTVSFYLTKKML